MSDENIFEELAETRRKLWAESDGTLDGYFRMCDRLGKEAHDRFLAEQAAKKAGRRMPPRRRKPEFADATAVHEDAPGYGEGLRTTGAGPRAPGGERSDFARETGAEGE